MRSVQKRLRADILPVWSRVRSVNKTFIAQGFFKLEKKNTLETLASPILLAKEHFDWLI